MRDTEVYNQHDDSVDMIIGIKKVEASMAYDLPARTTWPPKMQSGIAELQSTMKPKMRETMMKLKETMMKLRGHDPNIVRECSRLNTITGAAITKYHTFHDEVLYYRRYIWRCNSPCRERRPTYG
ncbi:hypothetical protein niasHT_025804 [Heterodera trifolii]|uniref:Uncharacterized protein n=1 Tax=Heterodera trifolii TaxID=157864 RepID=A0ABD2KT06_9BILA